VNSRRSAETHCLSSHRSRRRRRENAKGSLDTSLTNLAFKDRGPELGGELSDLVEFVVFDHLRNLRLRT
jgi:hypothetical protein